jgi:hypothetical protein
LGPPKLAYLYTQELTKFQLVKCNVRSAHFYIYSTRNACYKYKSVQTIVYSRIVLHSANYPHQSDSGIRQTLRRVVTTFFVVSLQTWLKLIRYIVHAYREVGAIVLAIFHDAKGKRNYLNHASNHWSMLCLLLAIDPVTSLLTT